MKALFPLVQNPIAAPDLAARLAAGLDGQVIDVRSPVEFNEGHIPGARLMPLPDLDPSALPGGDRRIYLVCQSGVRARQAAETIASAGIDRAVLLQGGMEAWSAAGLPIERTPGAAGLSIMRQVQLIIGAATAGGSVLALTVDPWFALIPLVSGSGLVFAGASGWCGLALLLAKAPWNRKPRCETQSCCVVAGGPSK